MDTFILRIVLPLTALAIALGVARLLKPPGDVTRRAIIAGAVFAAGNFLIDVMAINYSLWHYEMPGLVAGTPADLYITAGIIFGFVTSLLFWWLESRNKYLLYTYLIVLPFLTTARDYFSTRYAYKFLIWDSPNYLLFDFTAWVVLLAVTFLVFRLSALPFCLKHLSNRRR